MSALQQEEVPRLQAERNAAVRAARRAARFIRSRVGDAGARERKNLNDFVTEADERAQDLITSRLVDAFPAYDVLAEEGADLDGTPPVPERPRWIIDPIDGTTNFMHAVPPYAVSIALQREGALAVGVVLEVSSGRLYTATRGGGAYCDGTPLSARPVRTMSEALVATGFPFRTFEHLERYGRVLREVIRAAQGVRRHGAAAVDLARVAAGRFGGFFETGLRPWDVAAGALLVREAGGCVTDYRGRSAIDGEGFLFGGQIVATGGPLQGELLAFVEDMQDVRT